jgi:hypothetical protein
MHDKQHSIWEKRKRERRENNKKQDNHLVKAVRACVRLCLRACARVLTNVRDD